MTPCNFAAKGCNEPAVARFSTPAGCICFVNDTQQALCIHHYLKATPLGEMRLIEALDPSLWDWFLKTQEGR